MESPKVGQAQPQFPGASFATALDAVSQAIFTAMSTDPLLSPLARVVPPPPKISAFFKGQGIQQAGITPPGIFPTPGQLSIPPLPFLPSPQGAFPTLPGASEAAKQLLTPDRPELINPFT